MTAGTDGKTIDAMSLERIDRLIATLKDESYQPKDVYKRQMQIRRTAPMSQRSLFSSCAIS